MTNHSSPAHALLLRVGQLEAEVLEVAVGEQLLAAPAPRRVLVQTSGQRKIFLGPFKIFFINIEIFFKFNNKIKYILCYIILKCFLSLLIKYILTKLKLNTINTINEIYI